jgi:hypothetical protein
MSENVSKCLKMSHILRNERRRTAIPELIHYLTPPYEYRRDVARVTFRDTHLVFPVSSFQSRDLGRGPVGQWDTLCVSDSSHRRRVSAVTSLNDHI